MKNEKNLVRPKLDKVDVRATLVPKVMYNYYIIDLMYVVLHYVF